jgi:hypothetical protein
MSRKLAPHNPDAMLPEYKTINQAYSTLVEKVRNAGHGQMCTFVIDDRLAGVMVIAGIESISMISRVIATIGQSPVVNME